MATYSLEQFEPRSLPSGEAARLVPERILRELLRAQAPTKGGTGGLREPPADEVARALAILDDPNTKWHRAEDVLPQAIELGVSGLRKKFGLTQEQLAAELGISQPAISRIERNPDSASLGTIKRIVRALVAAAGRGEGDGDGVGGDRRGGDEKPGGGPGDRR